MPGLVRKLVVYAAVDGLILQPLHQRSQRGLQIDYKSYKVSPSTARPEPEDASLECYGIVGSRLQPQRWKTFANCGTSQVYSR